MTITQTDINSYCFTFLSPFLYFVHIFFKRLSYLSCIIKPYKQNIFSLLLINILFQERPPLAVFLFAEIFPSGNRKKLYFTVQIRKYSQESVKNCTFLSFRNRRFTKFDCRVVAVNRKTGYNIHTAAEIRPSIFQTEITDMILADKIQSLRKKSGMAQEEPAARVGVSRQAVSKWESRRAVPELKSKNL